MAGCEKLPPAPGIQSPRFELPVLDARPPSYHLYDDGLIPLFHRVRREFLEMPGLRLTPAHAAGLRALDHRTSQWILEGLTVAGFLLQNTEGAHLRASMA